ncbi:MAG: phosphoadenosine phosphosulfate reductase family protein, partial [Candidatus Marinimicrobia bacterium]|nr:phosphoadenosine phosphosulfate reductase family protein [Candidatus Neomarinimicrobiota bacterium]
MITLRKNSNALSNQFEDNHPEEILRWVAESSIPHRIGLGTGFGLAGLCLIDMLVKINKDIPIFYLDTEVLFPETYALRDRLEEKYQIKFVRYATPLTLAA